MLAQNLKTSVGKLKLQQDDDPELTSKDVTKWLKDSKVKVLQCRSHQSCHKD